jgi:phosphatidylserine/phosphatidylglycerophosphate/cardiolipin synthase-like enzyme
MSATIQRQVKSAFNQTTFGGEPMRAVAFANNDMAIIAWTFSGKIPGCLGFAVYRIDVRAGTQTCLPAMATFAGQQAAPGRTTADAPIQKFFWKDVYAKRGGTYKYKIVPMGGAPGNLAPLPYGPVVSNEIQLSPHFGMLSAYFNRGILATQATARALTVGPAAGSMLQKLDAKIDTVGDPLRVDLAGQMIEALTTLPKEAAAGGDDLYLALYEYEDPEVIASFEALQGKTHLILSNMPSGDAQHDNKTNDAYADERERSKAAGCDVIDRFMPSGHIGHNKFQVLVDADGPQAALFGSTNVTSHALCAQTNNTIIARSPGVAQAYMAYWDRLKGDTVPPGDGGKAQQSKAFRDANLHARTTIPLDGKASVDLWFSPNTPGPRGKDHGDNEPRPQDMQALFDIISDAKQAVLFLVFEPGRPSIIDYVADALKANANLFVRGAVTAADAAGGFYTAIHEGATGGPPPKHQKGDPPLPEDYRVIRAQGIDKSDAFGQWEAELNQAGHAIIHDKIVVVDPFSDNCVVAMGSHNLGYAASYNNDENLAIIRGHRAIAAAYAAHCLDVYDHYAWRYWLGEKKDDAWHFLSADDSWQGEYFDADSQVKSAELGFWLSATPPADAIPTSGDSSSRERPGLQSATGGVTPANGPLSADA